MNQTTYIAIAIAVIAVLLAIVYFYLRHAKTSPKKIEKSGVDITKLLSCLGSKENVEAVSANGSKVIFVLKDTRVIDSEGLKALGASGIVASKDKLTVIFGRASDALAQEIGQVL